MSMRENAQTIAENVPKVYEAGQQAEYDRFWDNYQQNGNRTNYAYAFAGQAWSYGNLTPKHPIKFYDAGENSRTSGGMFCWHGRGRTDYVLDVSTLDIDWSGCKSLYLTFANAKVDNITIDGSNVRLMSNTFSGADGGNTITTINIKITENCIDMSGAFGHCSRLTNLIFTDDSVIAVGFSLAQSKLLTTESVDSIIHALKDVTGQTALKITLHADVITKLTEEQLQQIADKNWQVG